MLQSTNCLLAINNYYYSRGGADVLFLEHNRMMERIGWQVVPFAMRHPKNLDTPWSDYFPDEIEFGSSYSLGDKLIRAPRVIYSMQTRRNMSRLLNAIDPSIAHIHNIYHHLSPSFLPLLKQRGIRVVMTVHDLKLACPAYTMMLGGKPCDRCRGGKLYNVAVNRCIKGSLALSSLVMVESYLHRLLRTYEGNIDRFVVPSRFVLEKLVQWGWARERFVHIPNFVDIERFNRIRRRPALCLLRPAGRTQGCRDPRAGCLLSAATTHAGRQRTPGGEAAGPRRRTWRRFDLYRSFDEGFPRRRDPERPGRHRAIRVS